MSDANPQSADQAGDAPVYIPQPADQVPPDPAPADQVPPGPAPAGPAPAGPAPAGRSLEFREGTIIGVDAHRYSVSVKLLGDSGHYVGVPYNPLAYIPRLDEQVRVAFVAGPRPGSVGHIWVVGLESWRMFGSPTYGRPPTAALWSDTSQTVTSGADNIWVVELDHKAWDTDNMLIELGDGQKTTKITPQRTGLYTIKAGGRWERDPRSRGRRGMDLRWDTKLPWDNGDIIARDEKAPNSEGLCGHSVSADVRITTSIDPAHASPWVRYLGAAVQLVVYQTSGHDLQLLSDRTSKPFLQMTYQGPMP